MEDPLRSSFLFTHVYDIDTVISGLCGAEPAVLDTRSGVLCRMAEGIPPAYAFEIEPLPGSIKTWLETHPDVQALDAADAASLKALLATVRVQEYPACFSNGRVGGWLYARLKDIAIEWLDGRGLIPPSMRHISRGNAPRVWAGASSKVCIVEAA